MNVDDAAARVALICEQMARSERFLGYRSSVVALSGLSAISAALVQPVLIPAPSEQIAAYLGLWISVAAFNVLVISASISARVIRDREPLAREKAVLAVELFAPCLVAGALLTIVIATSAPEAAWMLPGLWAICFSLGVFASQRCLTRAVFWIGLYYLAAGGACLWLGQGEAALSSWTMGGAFGGGQLLAALVLYWRLERGNG